jgi:hypothetical protein
LHQHAKLAAVALLNLQRASSLTAENEDSSKLVRADFLDFVNRLYFNKITTFRKLDLLPSSYKKKE